MAHFWKREKLSLLFCTLLLFPDFVMLNLDDELMVDGLKQGHWIYYQLSIDKIDLQSEVDSRQTNIEILRKIRGTTEFLTKHKDIKSPKKYFQTMSKYQGYPINAFMFIVISIMMARVLLLMITRLRPMWASESLPTTEYPLVPLVYFQQSSKEALLKRNNQKNIDDISKFFLIRANETYVDLDEIRNAAITRQTLARSPWALIRFMIRLQIIYSHTQKPPFGVPEKASEERESLGKKDNAAVVDLVMAKLAASNRRDEEDASDAERKKNARDLLKT